MSSNIISLKIDQWLLLLFLLTDTAQWLNPIVELSACWSLNLCSHGMSCVQWSQTQILKFPNLLWHKMKHDTSYDQQSTAKLGCQYFHCFTFHAMLKYPKTHGFFFHEVQGPCVWTNPNPTPSMDLWSSLPGFHFSSRAASVCPNQHS